MKKLLNSIYIVLANSIAYTLTPLAYIVFLYDKYINGVEPKSGNKLFKYKNSKTAHYHKRFGLKFIFTKWIKQEHKSYIKDLDVYSLYHQIRSIDNSAY